MIRSSVTISLVPSLRGGPWIFWDELSISIPKAAATGFHAVELFFDSPKNINAKDLTDLLKRNEVRLAAVGTGAGKVLHGLTLVDPDPTVRSRAMDFIREMIDFAAAFEAPAIIGSMQGNIPSGDNRDRCLDWLAEALRSLGQTAQSAGVNLIYEPLNRYETNLFNRVGDAAGFIESRKIAGVKLLADLFHMNIEEQNMEQAILACRDLIGHVHFADSNRRPVGLGHTQMEPVANALRQIGYEGYVSAEAFSYPDADRAASQTIAAFNRYFRNALSQSSRSGVEKER